MTRRFLLDTNVLSELAKPAPDPVVAKRLSSAAHEIVTAAVCWRELRYGMERLPPSRRKTELVVYLDEILRTVPILAYDASAAEWDARERARLEVAGRTPSPTDAQIASVACTQGLVLVTRNVRDFSAFEGLIVENWHPRARRSR